MFFIAATNNYTVVIRHIPGSHIVIADALSRVQMTKFRAQTPQAAPLPTQVPPEALTLLVSRTSSSLLRDGEHLGRHKAYIWSRCRPLYRFL
jgi:hypothetical protein